MAGSPKDVQSKLDAAVTQLQKTTSSYTSMVKMHGSDWTKWPNTSHWYLALSAIKAARDEVGSLIASSTLKADFKETQT